jgi:hypothetical protein
MSVRKPKRVKTTLEVKVSTPLDVHPIEIETMIIYKIILIVLMDGGCGLNIMPYSPRKS